MPDIHGERFDTRKATSLPFAAPRAGGSWLLLRSLFTSSDMPTPVVVRLRPRVLVNRAEAERTDMGRILAFHSFPRALVADDGGANAWFPESVNVVPARQLGPLHLGIHGRHANSDDPALWEGSSVHCHGSLRHGGSVPASLIRGLRGLLSQQARASGLVYGSQSARHAGG